MKLSFGFLGDLITREDDPDFDSREVNISLGYCPACRRNKPGVYSEITNEFLCMKCGYPIGEPISFKISKKLKYESRY